MLIAYGGSDEDGRRFNIIVIEIVISFRLDVARAAYCLMLSLPFA
jgi:hypothetical protein